ncbi:MAG: hypothetical protein R2764_06510 [Bacteroidales bacterium]
MLFFCKWAAYDPGGTHQAAFREAIEKRSVSFTTKILIQVIFVLILAAISLKVQEPVFESQTKTKLGSQYMEPGGVTVRNYINDIVKRNLIISCIKILILLMHCTRKFCNRKRNVKNLMVLRN